jgi:hypothetical protein
MIRIADVLDCDLSKPAEEFIKITDDDPDTVSAELAEYIATDRITAEYERLFSAIAAAAKSPSEDVGVWISGFLGSGKSSFAKILGYVLANREVNGSRASSLFLKQVESKPVAEAVEFLNRAVPYEVFRLDLATHPLLKTGAEHIAEVMYRVLLRDLDFAEEAPAPSKLSVKDLVERSFDLCAARRPGKAVAFIVDEVDQYIAHDGKRLENLLTVVGEFGRQGVERLQAGKIPAPAWIIVTAQQKMQEVCDSCAGIPINLPKLQDRFRHQIDLSDAGVREVVTRRVLRKKQSQVPILRKLFQDHAASLLKNVKLERSSRRTEFTEDEFVQSYPYLPHLIGLSIDILAGLGLQPNAQSYVGSSNRTVVKQCFEMLVSDRTRLAHQAVAALVSIDKIYELVEGNTPWEKQKDILDIRQRFDDDTDYPGMATRVAKAICLMELVQTDLPRTTSNIAALLVQRVNETPPVFAVEAILKRLKAAQFVFETEDGWKFYDFNELRRTVTDLKRLNTAVGTVNPRASGWYNDLIQRVKKVIARSLAWYIRPLQEFNSSVGRALEEIVGVLDHLSMNMAALDRFSMNRAALGRRTAVDQGALELSGPVSLDTVALDERLARLESRTAALTELIEQQLDLLHEQVQELGFLRQAEPRKAPAGSLEAGGDKRAREDSVPSLNTSLGSYRTAYVIGLFGSGRQYTNELIRHNIGERAKYFRDEIRVHSGPTPMIYSGHATIRYVSRAQELPALTGRVLESVRLGFADLIFIYRHPLDSLLTNWVWWRTKLRDGKTTLGISEIYKNTNDLCADLERNFSEFETFANGGPEFFAGARGPRFLSLREFVEETELYVQSATLSLRLEDFMTDPLKEFSKIVELMSVDLDLGQLYLAPPRSMPHRYLVANEKVPRFRNFIDGLDELTKIRIKKLGYKLRS